ncbi:predicted protein [Lichtheimia corymbifera JMRC:FSU:9682]|uniref:Uncharacterized protein n=1 Tax=Lichtheimia corymbifera JMRC:FSU:9682 TaxID=1263082 RepID=A0A068S7V6_9FUNG|nr:predicted protein [Lichtheimia corymbifera JMRC:FSU:9682]
MDNNSHAQCTFKQGCWRHYHHTSLSSIAYIIESSIAWYSLFYLLWYVYSNYLHFTYCLNRSHYSKASPNVDGKIYLIALDVKVCVIEVSGPQLHAFALGVKDDVPLPDKQEPRGCKEHHFYIYSLSMPFWGVMPLHHPYAGAVMAEHLRLCTMFIYEGAIDFSFWNGHSHNINALFRGIRPHHVICDSRWMKDIATLFTARPTNLSISSPSFPANILSLFVITEIPTPHKQECCRPHIFSFHCLTIGFNGNWNQILLESFVKRITNACPSSILSLFTYFDTFKPNRCSIAIHSAMFPFPCKRSFP